MYNVLLQIRAPDFDIYEIKKKKTNKNIKVIDGFI